MVVATQDEELVTFNDASADSVAFSTTDEKIGGAVKMICDGTNWIALYLSNAGQTVTIASA